MIRDSINKSPTFLIDVIPSSFHVQETILNLKYPIKTLKKKPTSFFIG